MQNQTFKLSLKPNDYPPNLPFVYADQYDVGRTFVATVYDTDGSLYAFSGETVTVVGTKPSGTGFSYTATASGNTVTFETTGQMTVVAGNVTCGIIIETDGDRIGTLHFILHVQPAALSADTIIDSNDFGSIISDAVAEYMEEHGIVIDPTLSVAGAAADAKATGDAIDELKSALTSDIAGVYNALLSNHFNGNLFAVGSLWAGQFRDATYYPHRIATPNSMTFPYDIYLSVKSGFRFAFHRFANGSFVQDSGWKTYLVKIPANTEFKITISRLPEASDTPNITEYCNALFCSLYVEESTPFTFSGVNIPFKKQRYVIEDTDIKAKTAANITVATVRNLQGFTYYGGVLFQCYDSNVIELIDYSTKTVISDLVVNIGHGNSIVFTDDFYDASDEFPMAIISDSQSTPELAYVVRITRSTATIIDTLSFPREQAGYFANALYDPLNKTIYTVGYYSNSYIDPTNNKMVFGKWDYTTLTTNGDGTKTPAFIKSFYTPFVITMQASSVFDNKMFLVSSHWENIDTKIYIVDLVSESVVSVIDDFPATIKTVELEGISIVENPTDSSEYVGLLKTANGNDSFKLLRSYI